MNHTDIDAVAALLAREHRTTAEDVKRELEDALHSSSYGGAPIGETLTRLAERAIAEKRRENSV